MIKELTSNKGELMLLGILSTIVQLVCWLLVGMSLLTSMFVSILVIALAKSSLTLLIFLTN